MFENSNINETYSKYDNQKVQTVYWIGVSWR